MAEGDTTGRGGTPTPDGHPTGERDAADRERRSEAGKKRGKGGEESPEVFARPSWDHAKDFPEPLAEGRTSTAVAIGLVAAALLGGGLLGAIGWNVLLGCRGGTARGAGEPDEIAGAPVEDTLEVAGDTDRPR